MSVFFRFEIFLQLCHFFFQLFNLFSFLSIRLGWFSLPFHHFLLFFQLLQLVLLHAFELFFLQPFQLLKLLSFLLQSVYLSFHLDFTLRNQQISPFLLIKHDLQLFHLITQCLDSDLFCLIPLFLLGCFFLLVHFLRFVKIIRLHDTTGRLSHIFFRLCFDFIVICFFVWSVVLVHLGIRFIAF